MRGDWVRGRKTEWGPPGRCPGAVLWGGPGVVAEEDAVPPWCITRDVAPRTGYVAGGTIMAGWVPLREGESLPWH
jgi:hypothetical protein